MPFLTTSDIAVIQRVHKGYCTLGDIAESSGLSLSRTSVIITRLEKEGYLKKERKGTRLKVFFQENPFMESYKQMLEDKLQLDLILADSGVPLLLAMIMPEMSKPGRNKVEKALSLKQIELFTGLSLVTIHRTLNRGLAAGAIKKDGTRYRISETMLQLKEFLKQFSKYLAISNLVEIAIAWSVDKIKMNIHFTSGNEFIFSTPADVDIQTHQNTFPSGLTAFQLDGLDFIANYHYYHFTGSSRFGKLEDYVVDILLTDLFSSRNVIYSMLFLKKNFNQIDTTYLLSLAEIFGLKKKSFRCWSSSGRTKRKGK